LIDIQSKIAETGQTSGHLFRGILGQASFNEVSIPLGAQFEAIDNNYTTVWLLEESKAWKWVNFPDSSAWVLSGVALVRLCQARFRVVTMAPHLQFPRSESPAVGLLSL